MKGFFSRNKKMVEIFLTLLLVITSGGYYYLIYIPEREDEIVERRFRTLQCIETNMQEKFQGYQKTITSCFTKADSKYFKEIVSNYNKAPEKFIINIIKTDTLLSKKGNVRYFDSIYTRLQNDKTYFATKVKPSNGGKKLIITSERYSELKGQRDSIRHITLESVIDYKEFVIPLLRKNVFDHYLVFNVTDNVSNIVYEDFPSGVSFTNLDSLYKTKQKIYSSRITQIETGGEKYLAFIHPCVYTTKNDRIVVGLMKQSKFDQEKRELPDKIVTAILFIALFAFLLLPIIRLKLMGKRERIRFFDVYGVYFCFLLIVPVAILLFFWNINNLKFINNQGKDSKLELANQISKSLVTEITSNCEVLDRIDKLHYLEKGLRVLDSVNVKFMGSVKTGSHTFGTNKKDLEKVISYNQAAKQLTKILNKDKKNTAIIIRNMYFG